jgi:hypothetical protein
MMAEGAQQIDGIFTQALANGQLSRDPSLNTPAPPLQAPVQAPPKVANLVNAYQVQVSGHDVIIYNFAMAHLRTLPGVDSATPEQINPGGTSYILVAYHGTAAQLAAALSARGWIAESGGTVVKIHSATDKPPPLPAPATPAQPAPAPTATAATQNVGATE